MHASFSRCAYPTSYATRNYSAASEKSRSFPKSLRPAGNVANFFESMGAFTRFNIIDRAIACDLWCGVVVSCWNAMLPIIRLRRDIDPGIWENFEYLAVLCQDFMEQHPTSYPSGMRRMRID